MISSKGGISNIRPVGGAGHALKSMSFDTYTCPYISVRQERTLPKNCVLDNVAHSLYIFKPLEQPEGEQPAVKESGRVVDQN